MGYQATPTPPPGAPLHQPLRGQTCLLPRKKKKKKLQPLPQNRGHPLYPQGHLRVLEPADCQTYLHFPKPSKNIPGRIFYNIQILSSSRGEGSEWVTAQFPVQRATLTPVSWLPPSPSDETAFVGAGLAPARNTHPSPNV